MEQFRRASATAAAVSALAGAILITIGVAALPHAWTTGYVSQAGVPGTAHASAYRIGVLLVALALFLLGNALAGIAGVLLIGGGALTAVSSRVTCTAGCPLPPYEHSTTQDLVHAGTSIAAVGLTMLAMLAIAAVSTDRRQARLARIGAIVCTPILLALAIALLAVGRSTLTAVLERIGLTAVLLWVIGCALLVRRSSTAPPPLHP